VFASSPASAITFHHVKNQKAVYAQRCFLIWFIVSLPLYSWKIRSRILQTAFHVNEWGHAHHQFYISSETYESLGAYLESIQGIKTLLKSGSWLKLTFPIFGSQRSKYSNRAVTYSNRKTLESMAHNSQVGCVSENRSRVQTRTFARRLREDLLSRGKITREFVISSACE